MMLGAPRTVINQQGVGRTSLGSQGSMAAMRSPPPSSSRPGHTAMASAAPACLDLVWRAASGSPALEDLIPASGDRLILRTKCIHVPSFFCAAGQRRAISCPRSRHMPAGADGTALTTATLGAGDTEEPGGDRLGDRESP